MHLMNIQITALELITTTIDDQVEVHLLQPELEMELFLILDRISEILEGVKDEVLVLQQLLRHLNQDKPSPQQQLYVQERMHAVLWALVDVLVELGYLSLQEYQRLRALPNAQIQLMHLVQWIVRIQKDMPRPMPMIHYSLVTK